MKKMLSIGALAVSGLLLVSTAVLAAEGGAAPAEGKAKTHMSGKHKKKAAKVKMTEEHAKSKATHSKGK